MITVLPKAKYRPRGSHWAKKIGTSGGGQSGVPRKRNRKPAPVSRLRTMVLSEGRKIRWEG